MTSFVGSVSQFRHTLKRLFGRQKTLCQRSTLPTVERMEERTLMAASFHAPAELSGTVNVQLVPLANVTVGTPEIVTFGVPFTRGSVSTTQLSQIRVLKNGAEVPAFVETLTPWRSIDDPALDGQSVRVARIQIPYTFSTLSPETITVQWGGPARTLNRTTLQDPRLEWHTVTSGTFVAADNVEEPDVLPVLPGSYLSKGMLDARTDPTPGIVAETRDNPSVMDTQTFSGYTEYDYAQKNFFYTLINQNGSTPIDYKTQPEPWLYDRSSSMYQLYLRSGFATALREAIRSTDFYADRLNSSGFFTLRSGDPKYAYNESLAYTYWLLGDNRMVAPITTVVNAFNGTTTRWSPNLSFWTERNVGYKLLATQVAYEVTGNTTFKNSVQTIVNDLIWHQNGANGQLPSNRVDGGLYHTGVQHDIGEASSASVLLASSWMSALIVDPMVRTYGVWQNPQIVDFLVRMGNFEKVASKVDANGQFGGTTRYPDYLMRVDGTSDNRTSSDVQHAMDVGAVAAWANYFAELRGTPDASLRQLANNLYATYDIGVNYWTSSTSFRVSPPRRYNWEYKNSTNFSWALNGTDPANLPGSMRFSAAMSSVVENQGLATITVTRTGGSAGVVTVPYSTSNGTATAGSDYLATSGTLTFAAGETSKSFSVAILNDNLVENAETILLTLGTPTGGASLGSPATATLSIDSDDTTNLPITATYQQGVNGYSGTIDAEISNQYGGNGTTSLTGTQLGVFQTAGTNSYTIEGLIRFSNLGITTNATTNANVTAATLTLTVDTYAANPILRGYYLRAPWTTEPGTDLGWLRTGTGTNWTLPGALGQGSDVISGKSFLLSGITGTGAQTISVSLDPTVVQAWIDNPNANLGVLLVNETTGAIVRVNASENATVAVRPKLSVSYTVTSTTQPGTLHWSGSTSSVQENGGAVTLTVTRTNGSAGLVTVNYATSNGSATAGADYTLTSGILTFAAGETSKTVIVPILNDTLVEGNETVHLTLSNPTGGATLGNTPTAILTIVDDDLSQPGVLQFHSSLYTLNENLGAVTLTITRTNGSTGLVTVNYATSNGSATAGADYTATSGVVTFAAGETSKTVIVPILNDTLVEGNETVHLTLSNPTGGASLGNTSTAILTIVDEDGAGATATFQQGVNGYSGTTDVSISTLYAQYTNGNGTTFFTDSQLGVYQTTGTNAYPIESLIRFGNLGPPSTAAVSSATLTLTADTWSANPTIRGYYLLAPWVGSSGSTLGWLNRGPGQTWAVPGARGQGTDVVAGSSFVLPPLTATGAQTITLNLDPTLVQNWITNPSANQGILLVNETPGAIVRINASENATIATRPKLSISYSLGTPQPGILQFQGATSTISESGGTALLTITRTNGSAGNVTVSYTTSNGTATSGSDYTATNGILTFAAGEMSKTIALPILNDSLVEGNETVHLTLSNPTGGATLGTPTTAILTIQDDDVASQPGTLQFHASSYSLSESGGSLVVTVLRTGGTSGTVSVQYATSNGTATAGSDYSATSGTLTLAAGETSKTFPIAVLNDSLVEGNETVTLTLSNPTGGATLGNPTSVVFTIVDDESAPSVQLPPGFTQSVVATGISSGTALAAAPDGRLFVLEQGGAVRVIKNGTLLATPAFTVSTVSEQERGLLSLTFDPNFTNNRYVYVSYTVGGPSPSPAHNRISRFTLSGDVAVVGSEVVLFELPETTSRVHASSTLKFGSDGKLYIAVGNDNVFGNSQSLTVPFGKILRINADGTIPADNPFFSQTTGVNRAIWALGLRNPYTMDIQPGTGLLYVNDVGEAAWEEINRGVAGANYGWPSSEGYTNNPAYQSPVYAYSHGTGANQGYAVVGAAFYNPTISTFPASYAGKYFFMDYVNGWISTVDPNAANPKTPTVFATNIPTRYDGGPVDLEVGTDGALYYLNRLGGGVFKIQYSPPPVGSFTNVTASSGVAGILNQVYQQNPNYWLTGQHLVDLDTDGDLDLFLDSHGGGNAVVALNNGQGVFTRITTGTFPTTEIHQMFDINGDGKVDLNVTYHDGGSQWWINHSTPGNVNFSPTNVTRGTNTSRAQVLFDFNGDGKVDWFRSAPPGLVVDFGDGNGNFAESSLTFPIPGTTSNENANFLSGDFDGDGDTDLLVLTGGGYDNTVGNTAYWRNNGNQTFTDITAGSGLPSNGTLVKGIGDFDHDGDLDLIAVANKSMPPLIYLNNGQGLFTLKPGAVTGVAPQSLDYAAWGTAITTDFDNDGVADILMNGKYYLKILRGTGGGNFLSMNTNWGIEDTAASAVDDGLCFGDLDGDGDLDIIGFNEIYPTRTLNVYRNDLANQNWLNVRVVGLAGNVSAAGAIIHIYATGTTQLLWREQVSIYDFQVATSYYAYDETERHFGLGQRTNVDVVVKFASGRVTRLNNVAANRTIRLLESAGL